MWCARCDLYVACDVCAVHVCDVWACMMCVGCACVCVVCECTCACTHIHARTHTHVRAPVQRGVALARLAAGSGSRLSLQERTMPGLCSLALSPHHDAPS